MGMQKRFEMFAHVVRTVACLMICGWLSGVSAAEVWYVPGWMRTADTNGNAYASCTNTYAQTVCRFRGWDGDCTWWTAAENADKEARRLADEIAATNADFRAGLTLVGHSLGGRIIAHTLAHLAEKGVTIRQGVMLAPAIPMRDPDVAKMGGGCELPALVVVNPQDTVLKYIFTISGQESPSLGTDGTLKPVANVSEYAVPSDITRQTEIDALWGKSEHLKRLCNHLAPFYFTELEKILAGAPSEKVQTRVVQGRINLEWKTIDAGVWWNVKDDCKGWKLERNIVTGHYRILNPDKRRVAWGGELEMRASFQKIKKQLLPPPRASDGAFKRLYYNNPGTTYLKAGLSSWPMVFDYDGDGDLDVVIHSGGIDTWKGTWFFENTGKKGERSPLFKPARKLANGGGDSAQILADGRLAVTEQGRVAFDYRENGMKQAKRFAGLPTNVHTNGVRGNVWRFADLDGDGREDLVVGVGDWKAYGWHDKWDAAGVWTNEPIHGLFYYIRNEATDATSEKWAKPELLRLANGRPIDVYGYAAPLFADWDGDGDLDLLTCDFIDNYTYFENIGTKTRPAFAAGRPILDKFLRPIKADLCMVTATVADWDDDGHPDFITCEEDARIAIIRNTGRLAMGIPVFDAPYHLRQERDEVHFGILATPAVVDWDGDGDQDIITGNSAGYVAFIENLSGPHRAEPAWAEPKLLEADGAPIRIIAGPNGSIQGPCEEKWGYTCLSVADWDGDGLPDVMLNSIRGDIVWCRNIGTRKKPQLAPPAPVAAEWPGEQPAQAWGWRKPYGSKNILTQWRTTPYMIDLDEDGLMDLVMLDVEGYLCLWRRARKDGRLVVLPPERCLCDEAGQPLLFAGKDTKAGPQSNYAGGSGRRKFCFTDWTGDGKKDLIANSRNVMLYEFLKRENGKWYFKNRGDLDKAPLAGHTTSPTACDFDGDGREELLVGAEDGFFYLLER